MGFFSRLRLAGQIITGKLAASWNYRGGTKSGHIFDGSKFSGNKLYPSGWDLDHETLRQNSRVAYWDSTQARAIITRLVDNTIGTGLALEVKPIWELVGGGGMSEEEKHKWCRDVEIRFNLWANSHEPDAAGKMTLYEMQAIEYLNRLRDGETFSVLRYSGDASRMSPLSIQMLLPEQVSSPYDPAAQEAAKSAGRRIHEGIELDPYGKELAIYVSKENDRAATRIPYTGSTGRQFVLHAANHDTLGSIRGTPILAPIVHELKKITDYTVAEIEAAVINAILAVWVKPGPDAAASQALAGVRRGSAALSNQPSRQEDRNDTGSTKFDKPGLIVQSLKAGEEVVSFDTKRPNANFGQFVKQIERTLGASVGAPLSVMNLEATKSYSAVRAEFILFWRKIEIERSKSSSQRDTPIFRAWFTEAVKNGEIKAPGFFDSSPIVKNAWLNCSWNGDKLPSIDPLKEAMADRTRIEDGITTRERVAMEYNGSDAIENITRLKIENDLLAEANASMKLSEISPEQVLNIPTNESTSMEENAS